MSCDRPLPATTVVDYFSAALSEAEEAEVEEHLFACDTCASRLARVGELTELVATVARRRGGINLSLTSALLDRLEADGLRLRHYRLAPGERIPCMVMAEDDLVVTWLTADLAGVETVALTICDDAGTVIRRLDDAPIDHASKQIIFAIAGDTVRTLPSMLLHLQLVARDGAGDRVLGDYTLSHTAFGATAS
ncbi:MAG: hypothetical protein JWM74_2564 [Myxococcaceae bacterium]|nr:hypothetical protein [Myxococcaceae bacterium]